MRLFFTALFVLTVSVLHAQNPSLVWAKSVGGPQLENSQAIAVDILGNVYTTGHFQGTADFDPGPSTFNLTAGGEEDIYISKLDASGNFVWARNIGGPADGNDRGMSIIVDSLGNVYTTGIFTGTVDFDPGPGTTNLSSTAVFLEYDVFILKLNSSGNFVWAKRIGGPSLDNALSLTIARSSLYITGHFRSTTDFDPGPATFNMTSAGGSDIFIAKLDTAGSFLWARKMGGTGADVAWSTVVSNEGIYTGGYFSANADFDPGPASFDMTSAGSTDAFICKLDTLGNFVWAKRMGSTGDDVSFSIAVSGNSLYSTGYYSGTVDFNPGAGTTNLMSVGGWDNFVSRFDTAGNHIWARSFGGPNNDVLYSIAVNGSSIYSTGIFSGTVDFDPGAGTNNITAAGGDIFLNKLDTLGNFMWARSFGNPNDNYGIALAATQADVYLTGFFAGTTDFDPGPGTFNLSPGGSGDVFVLKLLDLGSLPIVLKEFKLSYTNNVTKLTWTTASEQNGLYFNIEKSGDGTSFQTLGTVKAKGNSSTTTAYNYADNNFNGVAYYRLKLIDADGKFFYSSVLRATVAVKQSVSVYPNPITSIFNLQIIKPKGLYELKIYSAAGQLVYKKTITHNGGNATETINLPSIAKGLYKLQLVDEKGVAETLGLSMK